MPALTKVFAVLTGMFLAVVVTWVVLHPDRKQGARANAGTVSTGLRVDLNRDDVATLTLLPGVGPGIAQHIVDAREDGMVFERAEDLEPVKFIGPSVISRVRPWVLGGNVSAQ